MSPPFKIKTENRLGFMAVQNPCIGVWNGCQAMFPALLRLRELETSASWRARFSSTQLHCQGTLECFQQSFFPRTGRRDVIPDGFGCDLRHGEKSQVWRSVRRVHSGNQTEMNPKRMSASDKVPTIAHKRIPWRRGRTPTSFNVDLEIPVPIR